MSNTVNNGASRSNDEHIVSANGTEECLIATVRGAQAQAAQIMPMSSLELQSVVTSVPQIRIKKTIKSANAASPMSMTAGEALDVHVADIDSQDIAMLRNQTQNRMIIEHNEPLEYTGMSMFRAPSYQPPVDYSAAAKPTKVKCRIIGAGGKPQPNARVMLQGTGIQQTGMTDNKGEVTLDLWTTNDEPARSIWVKPKNNHWDLFLERPNLVDTTINIIQLEPFSQNAPNFPDVFSLGWGLDVMGLADRPKHANGKGVKIAIIDSGCDTSHPLLNHVSNGYDASNEGTANGWSNDTIGHGTHVAGIITANGGQHGTMLKGFAPEAEIHIIKVFPGGYDSLIEALQYCIRNEIDIANMSLGGAEISQTVEQAIQEATLAGVACIVAAGNSGDDVKYPASSQFTMAVSAMGNLKKTKKNSWGNTQVVANSIGTDDSFAAKFSCHGPEINVCAPGVAIVSTLPDGAFGTDDGTSMATPHVTGLASLLLAHLPIFQQQFAERNVDRVTALFSLMRDLCRPLNFTDGRAGSGVPTLDQRIFSGFVAGKERTDTSNPANVVNGGQDTGHVLNSFSAGPQGNVGGETPRPGGIQRPQFYQKPYQQPYPISYNPYLRPAPRAPYFGGYRNYR